ncbi:MAG: DUF1990 family protein [Acidimicrobiales bacterium]
MLRLTRPTETDVDHYRDRVANLSPTYPAPGDFHSFERTAIVGHGYNALTAGRQSLLQWQMHTAAGVSVDPTPLEPNQTVILWTQTLRIWILFACRISDVIDETDRFGFTYITLPDHPEQGEETFMLHLQDKIVHFTVSARSRPGTTISRAAGPIGKALQRRYSNQYLTAMKTCIAQSL